MGQSGVSQQSWESSRVYAHMQMGEGVRERDYRWNGEGA